jgi:TPR repeat protein
MGSEPARQALANLGARAGGGDGLRGSGASPGGGAASSAEFRRGVELYKAERFAEAAALFQALAERGHVLSQRQVGYQYEFGEGLPRNPALAARWYRRAAEQGDAPAQNNLANCYENGIGVAENWAESFRWLQRSAKQNNARGLFGVGRAYQFGIGVPQDRAEAIRWFDRAAARGDDQANYWHDTLRGRGNFIGFRNEAEQQYVVGGRLPTDTALVFAEPRGMAFTNSAQRNAYLVRLKTDTLYNEAKAKWNMAADRYAACKRGETGESYCSSPGPSP